MTKPIPSIFTEAEQIISGPRRESYGPVEESFQRVAAMWGAILNFKVTGHQVALCMAALKLCRESNRAGHDNRLDAIGYIGLADKIAPPAG